MDSSILARLLHPIVRLCVRGEFPIQEFVSVLKSVYLEVASDELNRSEQKVNASRVALVTGLHREEVKRLYSAQTAKSPTEPISLLAKVIATWRHDDRFRSNSKEPRVLTWEGESNEFKSLCAAVNKSLSSGTILSELERRQYVQKTPRGLKLLKQMQGFQSEPEGGYKLLAREIGSLTDTVEENLSRRCPMNNLHIRTEYDNIRAKSIPRIRRWLIEEGKDFHRRAREMLSKEDLDTNPAEDETVEGKANVVLSAFSFTSWPDTLAGIEIPPRSEG